MDDITEIKEKIAAIELSLQRLPEIQAATFIMMWDEYQAGKLAGKSPAELWSISPPNSR